MPVYEYECQSCGKHLEKIQKFSDPPLTRCENCGGLLKKILSLPALVFKGSGFYITDYAKKQDKPTSGKDQTASDKPKESSTASPAATSSTPSPPSTSSKDKS